MGTRTRKRPDDSREPGPITPEGYAALERQSRELWKESRVVADAVAVAAAEGDRSENAEYTYSKLRLGRIHGKLRILGNRLEAVTVIHGPPPADGKVHFGCWVDLEDETGEEHRYRIVGPDETDVARGWISFHAPVAKALLGRSEDDEILLPRPRGETTATITAVHITEPS